MASGNIGVEPPETRTSPRLHYAWVVLAVTFVCLLTAAAVRSLPGILMRPLEAEFGWNRATIGLAVSINVLLFGLAGPLLGRVMDRVGPRAVASAATLLIALGAAGTLGMTQPWHMDLLWGVVVGTGSGGATMVMGSPSPTGGSAGTAVSPWGSWARRRRPARSSSPRRSCS